MRWLFAVVVYLFFFSPSQVRAEEQLPVAYHGLRFLGIEQTDESQFQNTIRESLEKTKYLKLTFTSSDITNNTCKRDIHCHCRVAREHQAARALFGNIGRIGPIFTFELILVETQSCTIENSVFVSESQNVASARKRLEDLVVRLTMPLESLSETAVKDEREVETAPAILTVFTARQIKQLGVNNLCELIQLVPGFECLDANYGDLVLHQGLGSTILYLLDGVPLSNPMQNFSILRADFRISLNHIERVEFVRGPGSVLWGPNAYLGIINFITKSATHPSPQITAQASYGTSNTADFFASVEQNHKWFRYFFSTTLNLSQGPQSFVENSLWAQRENGSWVWGNAGTTQPQTDTYYDIVAKVEILRRLQLFVHYLRHENYYEISTEGSLLSPSAFGIWDKWDRIYGLSWEDTLGAGFKYKLSGSRYEHRSWEHYGFYPPSSLGIPEGEQYIQGNETEPQVSQQVEGRLYYDYQDTIWGSQTLLGLSYLNQWVPDSYATITGYTVVSSLPSLDFVGHRQQTLASFFHEDLSIMKWLYLSGGLRLEYSDPFGSALTSQAGLIVHTLYLDTKLIYSEGYRPPTANDLYSTTGVKGNLDLKPERSRAISLETQAHIGPLRFKTGFTRVDLLDLIRAKPIDPPEDGFTSQSINKTKNVIYAAYGELQGEWQQRFNFFLNYNWKKIDETEPVGTGRAMAPHTASLGLSFRPIDDLNLFATSYLIGPRTVAMLDPSSKDPDPRKQFLMKDLSPVFDLSIGAWLTNIIEHLDIGLKIHNPFGFTHQTSYDLTGHPAHLLENRRVSEVFLTLRWASAFDVPEQNAGLAKNSMPQHTAPASAPTPPTPPVVPLPETNEVNP